jgi:hypothetical protein
MNLTEIAAVTCALILHGQTLTVASAFSLSLCFGLFCMADRMISSISARFGMAGVTYISHEWEEALLLV